LNPDDDKTQTKELSLIGMKALIRFYIVNTFSLYLASQMTTGLIFGNGTQTLLITGGVLTGTSLLAKPVINLLLLPINLITFGLFSWVSSAIALYIVTLLVKEFKIVNFAFVGFSSQWFEIPSFELRGILAYVGFAFVISFLGGLVHWVLKK